MKRILLLLISFAILSGFTLYPEPSVEFDPNDPEEIMSILSNNFIGISDWQFDKEQNAYLNDGFEIYMNDEGDRVHHILLKGLTDQTVYDTLDFLGIIPNGLTKYVIDNGKGVFMDMIIEEGYAVGITNLKPIVSFITVGLYFDEKNVEEMIESQQALLTEVLAQ